MPQQTALFREWNHAACALSWVIKQSMISEEVVVTLLKCWCDPGVVEHMEMSQLSERCFQRSVLTNTVPDYSHQAERKLMPSVNKKVFQLFCHKFFGKHTVKKKHHTYLPDTKNCDSPRGKKSWWKWIISKWIFESSCVTPFGMFALSPFYFHTN